VAEASRAEPASPPHERRRRLPSRRLVAFTALPAFLAGVLVWVLAGGFAQSIDPATAPGPPPERLAELAAAPGPSGGEPASLASAAQSAAADIAGLRPARPRRISIPAAGVDAPLEAVGRRGDRIRLPAPKHAGWFRDGSRPGEPGRTVVVGHRDTGHGKAVLTDVHAIRAGHRIEVTDARGVRNRYRVVGRTAVRKQSFPADAVYGHSRRPVLVLVTCGGRFDPRTGYEENVLVYARPA